jgi:hypothetical protein
LDYSVLLIVAVSFESRTRDKAEINLKEIVVTNMTEYEKLTRKLFFGSKNVRRFRTIIVMGVEKLGLEVPIV